MGSDVVGFHTYDYARHFISSTQRLLGVNPHESQIAYQDRVVQVGTYPIGIDYKKSGLDIKDKLNSDLANKKVTIAFDNVKVQDNTLCVYLYVDGNLYNQKLLKDGLAILNVEKANTSLLNELVNAQKQAKTNNIGIWQK